MMHRTSIARELGWVCVALAIALSGCSNREPATSRAVGGVTYGGDQECYCPSKNQDEVKDCIAYHQRCAIVAGLEPVNEDCKLVTHPITCNKNSCGSENVASDTGCEMRKTLTDLHVCESTGSKKQLCSEQVASQRSRSGTTAAPTSPRIPATRRAARCASETATGSTTRAPRGHPRSEPTCATGSRDGHRISGVVLRLARIDAPVIARGLLVSERFMARMRNTDPAMHVQSQVLELSADRNP